MSDLKLRDRIAVVTGGESGIGAACVAALAAAGADVAMIYHANEQKADASMAAVTALGRRSVAAMADVGSEQDVEAAFDRITEALGIPDILVNSAGINMAGVLVTKMKLEQWDRMLRTDLTGTFLASSRFVRDL